MPRSETARFDHRTGAPVGAETVRAPLGYEPPRFCALCGRRMVVQVFPTGWTAACSRHPLLRG
nr:hypothetical protein [Rhodococcus kroppenstedtii]